MKILNIISAVALSAFLFTGCEKEEGQLTGDLSSGVDKKSTFNKKSAIVSGVILEDDSLNHNLYLGNVLSEVKNQGCNINFSQFESIYYEEISKLNSNVENDSILGNANDFIVINHHVTELITSDEVVDISYLPNHLQNDILNIYNGIPAFFKTELKSTYEDMKSGVIAPSNYQSEFQSRYDDMKLLVNNQNEQYLIEAYLKVGTQSYEFWIDSQSGGLNGLNDYDSCLTYTNFNNYGNPEMNDNDWPNDVPFPLTGKQVLKDIGGAILGWPIPWRMIGGAVMGSAS